MKNIQILGGGCANCDILMQQTILAAENLGLKYTIEKVSDFEKIVAMGVMATPALVVNNEVKFFGQVLKAKEIEDYLK